MKTTISIFWFRRDLRLNDNCGLFHALISDKKILPIFIFDEDILSKLPADDARVSFLHQELRNIHHQLLELNSNLSVFHGNPLKVLKKLSEQYTIETVFTNHDYEPYAIQRDLEIKDFLTSKHIQFTTYKDQVVFEKRNRA